MLIIYSINKSYYMLYLLNLVHIISSLPAIVFNIVKNFNIVYKVVVHSVFYTIQHSEARLKALTHSSQSIFTLKFPADFFGQESSYCTQN